MSIPSDLNQVLEEAVDGSSVARVLEALATVCFEKADHLRSTWQDEPAGKAWDRDANKLLKLAAKLEH